MQFIFPTPVSIRHLWQLKSVVFLHRCLINAVLFVLTLTRQGKLIQYKIIPSNYCVNRSSNFLVFFKAQFTLLTKWSDFEDWCHSISKFWRECVSFFKGDSSHYFLWKEASLLNKLCADCLNARVLGVGVWSSVRVVGQV